MYRRESLAQSVVCFDSKTKGAVDYIKNNKISIFPNQNGVFCTLDKLSVDVDLMKYIKIF